MRTTYAGSWELKRQKGGRAQKDDSCHCCQSAGVSSVGLLHEDGVLRSRSLAPELVHPVIVNMIMMWYCSSLYRCRSQVRIRAVRHVCGECL